MGYNTRANISQMIEMLMESHPDGLTTGDLAEKLGVTSQAVRGYLITLSEEHVPYYQNEGTHRYTLNPRDYLRPLHLSLVHAWYLYLPLRRMVRAGLTRHSAIHTLLHRIATALYSEISDRLLPDAAPQKQSGTNIMEVLVAGWQQQRLVRIQYRPLDRPPINHDIAPWWFEPAPWSDSNYVIAGVARREAVEPIPFKIDRVQQARLLEQQFERPPADLLLREIERAWGIWRGEGEPEQVVLRFHYRVRDRVRETHWHPTERLEEDAQGSLVWSADISEVREMLPWIRGWGSDVEVIAPAELRAIVADDARRTVRLYDDANDKPRSFF